jgi:hypothetical protein
MRDLDTRGFLAGVTTFNFHLHLPHYALTTPTVFAFWPGSRSIFRDRIHSPRLEIESSTRSSGCLQVVDAPATC